MTATTTATPEKAFRQAMEAAGVTAPSEIILDGKLRRFSTNSDPDDDAGWYVGYLDGIPSGAFGDWRTGVNEKWCAKSDLTLTKAERAQFRERIATAQQNRAEEDQQRHKEAAQLATKIWEGSSEVDSTHAYLEAKKVPPYGVRLYRGTLSVAGCAMDGALIVPIRDTNGAIWSLEFITADGRKMFLAGGKKTGLFCTIGEIAETLCIVEGYATGASLYEATGLAVAVAFDASNLRPVAETVRGQYPDTTIIICGDNDANETGQIRAKEAAQAVNGLVVIPQSEGDDWNDVATRCGRKYVRRAIAQAIQQEELRRLAAMPRMEYGHARKLAAKKWGVRVSDVDAVVAECQANLQTDDSGIKVTTVKPSVESADGPVLAEDLAATIRRFIVLETTFIDGVVLWILWAHAFFLDIWEIAPNLGFTSPEMRCGKTSVLSLLANILDRPLLTSNLTPSTLFRAVEAFNPSLIIDEMDTFQEADETLRGVLNSGHTKVTARVLRVCGERHEVTAFSTWCPKVFACIGSLPPTIRDRTIMIPMQRKLHGEITERLQWAGKRGAALKSTLQLLAQRCKRWVHDHREELAECEPVLPSGLNDRQHDCWFAIFAIAEVLGGEWPGRAKRAALVLCNRSQDGDSVKVQLLEDLRGIIDSMPKVDAVWSQDLCDRLAIMEERPWCEFHKGKPITTGQLARLLRPFEVRSRHVRRGEEVKRGYPVEDLRAMFDRYISFTPEDYGIPKCYSATTQSQQCDSPLFSSATGFQRSASEKPTNHSPRATCSGVADEKPKTELGGAFVVGDGEVEAPDLVPTKRHTIEPEEVIDL